MFTSQLYDFTVPLAALSEQQEIVRRVEEQMRLADLVETRATRTAEHVERMRQALLAKAFRGELVPQDPNDEPADMLLARLQSDRLEEPRRERRAAHARS